jgi:hypothetical protein
VHLATSLKAIARHYVCVHEQHLNRMAVMIGRLDPAGSTRQKAVALAGEEGADVAESDSRRSAATRPCRPERRDRDQDRNR